VSTAKLRDQLRCFEIYRAQTQQLEKRVHSVAYQSEIGEKRLRRLDAFRREKELSIAALDAEMDAMTREKEALSAELRDLEAEQAHIDENERGYVARLKEQLRRLGKGMEAKQKSMAIFRRNVVEERLRIHAIDDSLKKSRTNANPTTASDEQLINATQHEALQAREEYAERTQSQSFFADIQTHEAALIRVIEETQKMDDQIYAQKWNIIQKSWNQKKLLLEAGKLKQMKKYLRRQEQNSKRHKRDRSKANYRRQTSKNLSHGAKAQFRRQSMGSANDFLG
jgi:hypothetical protein